jgi:hypothetical protein
MKRVLYWMSRPMNLALELLVVSVLAFTGCNGNGDGAGNGVAVVKLLDESQAVAIKKTAKSPRELTKNLRKKIYENEGHTIDDSPSKKVSRRGR